MTRPRQMTDGVRKAVEIFCLTGGIYTSILLAIKSSHGAGISEKRIIVVAICGFAVASMIYCMTRIAAEGKKDKETSNQKVDHISKGSNTSL